MLPADGLRVDESENALGNVELRRAELAHSRLSPAAIRHTTVTSHNYEVLQQHPGIWGGAMVIRFPPFYT